MAILIHYGHGSWIRRNSDQNVVPQQNQTNSEESERVLRIILMKKLPGLEASEMALREAEKLRDTEDREKEDFELQPGGILDVLELGFLRRSSKLTKWWIFHGFSVVFDGFLVGLLNLGHFCIVEYIDSF